MPGDLKPVLARQMEVYAGFLEHTDHHAGRLIDALADLGILDNTLIYCIIGDNGALGIGVGIAATALVEHLTPLPTQVTVWSVGLAFGTSALLGLLFGVVPAHHAGRLDPITALRTE
jgi:arylsulfatase A-like enzyme